MACDGRVAVENAVVGLPEGTFGIIPGAGGTVRLPRLVDATTALEIITTRRRVTATEAKMLGLVDMVIVDLSADASAYALALGGRKHRLREVPPKPFDPDAFEQAAETAMRKERGWPHVIEAIAAVRRTLAQPIDVALAEERAVFQRLRMSEESAALRHIFFAEREAARVEGLSGVQTLPLHSVGIVGAGTMGAGIAASFLLAGLPVTLTDLKPEALTTARDRIDGFVARAPGAARAAALTIADSLDGVSDCDLILEAVFEDMEVKRSLMAALDAGTRPDAILASNTSYLDLDEIAAATRRPASVIGLHFFAPAHIMKLLEIVRGAKTSAAALATAVQLGHKLGKIAVVAGVCEGFIGNRIYNAYRAQCEAMLIEGSTPTEVDEAMEAFGFAMGPFAVWDLSGLDIAWANRKRKLDAGGDRGAFVPLLEWLVGEGRLGRKTGAGWYRYVGGEATRQADMHVADLIDRAQREHGRASQAPTQEAIQQRALAAIVNEGLLILEDGIAARASDIDLVMINGYGFPKHLGGPLHWAARPDRAEIGRMLDAIVVSGARRGDLGRLDCGALR
jgi:3-hydroxyacyl-CoA dehydrogenase